MNANNIPINNNVLGSYKKVTFVNECVSTQKNDIIEMFEDYEDSNAIKKIEKENKWVSHKELTKEIGFDFFD